MFNFFLKEVMVEFECGVRMCGIEMRVVVVFFVKKLKMCVLNFKKNVVKSVLKLSFSSKRVVKGLVYVY